MKHMKPGRNNREDRLNFIRYWAEYVRTNPDWSRQQNFLINAMMKNAKNFPLSPKQYLALKKEWCERE